LKTVPFDERYAGKACLTLLTAIRLALAQPCEACKEIRHNPTDLLYDPHEAVMLYDCAQCHAEYKHVVACFGLSMSRCPFCDGRLLMAGISIFEPAGFSYGRVCIKCDAAVRQHSYEAF
jgi:DNA-directed RNA polymerase subunit RPC12/RpoP